MNQELQKIGEQTPKLSEIVMKILLGISGLSGIQVNTLIARLGQSIIGRIVIHSSGISFIGGAETVIHMFFEFLVKKGLPSYLAVTIVVIAHILLLTILIKLVIEAVGELFEWYVIKYIHAKKTWKKHVYEENLEEHKTPE